VAAAVLAGLAAVFFATVRPTNFGGSDEWLCLSLLSRGTLDFPYANRPLNLVWNLPAWLFLPDRLVGFLAFHAAWIGLAGLVVFLIVRRLLPGAAPLALLAGALTVFWAPTDGTRLCPVHMTVYSGCTFGALLATWLLLEAWLRRSLALAALAFAAAAVAVLSTEAALAPLPLVPLVLLAAGGWREPRRLALWTAGAAAAVLALGLRAVLPMWLEPERVTYQAAFAAGGLQPTRLAAGSLAQLRRHVSPVVEPLPGDMAWVPVGVGFALVAAGMLLLARRSAPGDVPARRLLAAAGLGVLWALAAYLPRAASTRQASRTQFVSAPGVAVLLAAGVFLLVSLAPGRARAPLAALLGAAIVASGIQRTAAFQERWDTWSAYGDQRQTLLELAAIAPDLRPGTLVVLLQARSRWPLDLTFRHAVRYLYEDRAAGHVPAADAFLYETRVESGGILSSPAPVLRRPWGEAERLYPHDAVVVVREDASGRLRLLDAWPKELGPLPPGASYAPRARIVVGPRLPRLRLLAVAPPGGAG
jgi:hypothetical protein